MYVCIILFARGLGHVDKYIYGLLLISNIC